LLEQTVPAPVILQAIWIKLEFLTLPEPVS
jgi:hypothetical protein